MILQRTNSLLEVFSNVFKYQKSIGGYINEGIKFFQTFQNMMNLILLRMFLKKTFDAGLKERSPLIVTV
jgi:hypothetical protein